MEHIMNRLIEKIRSYLKDMNLDELKYKYQDQSTNDDFIEYEPLPKGMVDDSNKQMLQEIADRNGF